MERVVGNRSPSTPYMASSNSACSCVALCLIETPIGQESSKMLLISQFDKCTVWFGMLPVWFDLDVRITSGLLSNGEAILSSALILRPTCYIHRPKDMDTPRTLYNISSSSPGSEVSAEAATALAAASLVFNPVDSTYSSTYLNLLISTEVLTKHLAPSTAHTQATR
ncbi:putative cellulase [Arabidopsis thaliana]|uniref:Six-hairpin glycosidase superfamily n=1 Tax=Arabidopsis thaliana x Arabidopsis arenosa TaxID=1240361 RepID=A0A8T2ESS1_9BRAS|nr:Six-hairpin glycosidase superfamily [Arabidopsis thaliana x Arabidopsis arenosa]